jgi:hypothetical protein
MRGRPWLPQTSALKRQCDASLAHRRDDRSAAQQPHDAPHGSCPTTVRRRLQALTLGELAGHAGGGQGGGQQLVVAVDDVASEVNRPDLIARGRA